MSHSFADNPGAAAQILECIAGLFTGAHRNAWDRGFLKSERVDVPVVSVGNLTVGGTGKTPCVLWLARSFREQGLRPAIISRGYGRRGSGVTRVSVETSTALDVGDEPLEMALALPGVPVIVGRNRPAAARKALSGGDVDLILMDDGFQHRPLHRDFDLVLLDAARPFGNGHGLPAGPLREPPGALRRADAILLTRADRVDDSAAVRQELARLAPRAWISTAVHECAGLEPLGGTTRTGTPAAGDEVVIVVGVADPASVMTAAEGLGLRVSHLLAHGDHHPFTERDIQEVENIRDGLAVLTTGKDAARLRTVPGFRDGWWVIRTGFKPAEPEALLESIRGHL